MNSVGSMGSAKVGTCVGVKPATAGKSSFLTDGTTDYSAEIIFGTDVKKRNFRAYYGQDIWGDIPGTPRPSSPYYGFAVKYTPNADFMIGTEIYGRQACGGDDGSACRGHVKNHVFDEGIALFAGLIPEIPCKIPAETGRSMSSGVSPKKSVLTVILSIRSSYPCHQIDYQGATDGDKHICEGIGRSVSEGRRRAFSVILETEKSRRDISCPAA